MSETSEGDQRNQAAADATKGLETLKGGILAASQEKAREYALRIFNGESPKDIGIAGGSKLAEAVMDDLVSLSVERYFNNELSDTDAAQWIMRTKLPKEQIVSKIQSVAEKMVADGVDRDKIQEKINSLTAQIRLLISE